MTRTSNAWRALASAFVVGPVLAAAVLASPASATSKASITVTKPSSASVSETGSTLMYPLWNIWVPSYTKKYPQVSITTAGTGSGTGISDAANGTADIGASDAYLSPSEKSANPHLLNIPLAVSSQFVAYHLPGVPNLKLSGPVLADIYQGTIMKWNNSAIAKLNPGVTLPDTTIVTLHRSDGSGDTFLFTQYLSKSDPNGWGAKISYGTTVSWPNVPGALGEDGNSGMLSGCDATSGCVAYIGVSYLSKALAAGLQEAKLKNASGAYLLPTSKTIEAEANSFIKKTPSNGTISLVYGPVKDGYPIVNYEYGIVSTDQSSSSVASAVRSVLLWAISPKDGNSSTYLDQVSFQALPAKVATQSANQIAKVK